MLTKPSKALAARAGQHRQFVSKFYIIGLIPDKQISGEQVASPYLRFAFTSFILAIELLL